MLRLPNIIFLFEFLRSMVFTTASVPLIGDRNLRRKEITALLGAICSKTYPSFLTVKEGSTSHLGLLPSGKKRKTALLGARNRYALRLADHQRSTPSFAGWDRRGDCLLIAPSWLVPHCCFALHLSILEWGKLYLSTYTWFMTKHFYRFSKFCQYFTKIRIVISDDYRSNIVYSIFI